LVVLKRRFQSLTGEEVAVVCVKGARVERPPVRGELVPMAFPTSQNLMMRSSPEVNSWVGVSVELIADAEGDELELGVELELELWEDKAQRLSRQGQVSHAAVLMHPPCRMEGTEVTVGPGRWSVLPKVNNQTQDLNAPH
jgi:hypothetical protein